MAGLVRRVGELFGLTLVVHDEVSLAAIQSRPDIAVDVTSGRVGYIELKAPGKGVPGAWSGASKHDREQFERLKTLPNLVYTDGNSWALYRRGVLVGEIGLLAGDLASAGRRLAPTDAALERLLTDFLLWRPAAPRSVRAVVADVAPLCRLLRDQVWETIQRETTQPGRRPFTGLATEWRAILFPVPDPQRNADEVFADAYAQAVTFALLLARVDGVSFEGKTPAGIAEQLAKKHSLLGEALAILANSKWVRQLNVVELLVRVIGGIDWARVRLDEDDAYSQLYEMFLAEYDPELRRRSGTYYTPVPVARGMVGFVDEVLKTRLGRSRGFAADDVIVLDPAMGAGTFLVEVLAAAAATLRVERGSSTVPKAHLRELFAHRLIGFELQAAPYAVAELRLHTALRTLYRVDIPAEEPRFLTDALDDPDKMSLDLGQLYEALTETRRQANRIKRAVRVMVVIGNPPWRERAKGAAPWLEQRRDPARPQSTKEYPSLDEFRPPQGRLAFNLNNMWTYFWRWATWKAFEANEPAGIVALITPSAYLTSESYAGMRRYLRAVADEGWIIDLSPEEHRSAVTTRVFPATQHPVCIGVFVCKGPRAPDVPARVRYWSISGTQQEKFSAILTAKPDSDVWRDCPTHWGAAFRPGDTEWDAWVPVSDLLPWHHTGVNSNRNWVWAPDSRTLTQRWQQLVHAGQAEKPILFKETRDRRIDGIYKGGHGFPAGHGSLAADATAEPTTVRVAWRSFDRQYLIYDRRVVDYPRPELWQVLGPRQIYTCEQHTVPISDGPALVFSALVPNVHNFNNRGGRVLPLYRDSGATTPNVAPRLLSTLAQFLAVAVSADDLLAYVAAVVAHPGYTRRYAERLRTPGVRVPITLDPDLWRAGVEIGRKVIWLHTFGERFANPAAGRPPGPPRTSADRIPRYIQSVPDGNEQIPDRIDYEPDTEALVIGDQVCGGRVRPVSPAVWRYTVGGRQIIRQWIGYRLLSSRHRKRTSALDAITSSQWTAQFDDELLDLLNVLDGCVALEPAQANLLDSIVAAPILTVNDLQSHDVFPVRPQNRKAPRADLPGTLWAP
ncbi:type ISP restriction/modification enzyme [Nocardia sp. NPDC046473]|uniref:type ISP restriction/modification enzyme n=1 Tax=Nocardia sp. NPDC046473 TaxID=3155733 RepID=UPI0033ECDDA7